MYINTRHTFNQC